MESSGKMMLYKRRCWCSYSAFGRPSVDTFHVCNRDHLFQGTVGMELQVRVWRDVVTALEKHHAQAKHFKTWLDWDDRGVEE